MAKDIAGNPLTNKRVDNDGRNRTVNIILSIILGVIVWGYVTGLVNPETEKTLSNINVSTVGKLDLKEKGLAVVAEDTTVVTVEVMGRRSDIYNVTASQILAKIDLTECELGENRVPIKLTLPPGVTEAEVKPAFVSVTVNRIITESYPVMVSAVGEIPDGYELGAVILDQQELAVTGGSNLVNKVKTLKAELTVYEGTENYAAKLSLVPVDATGKMVEGVSLEQDWVHVEAKLLKMKQVPIKSAITGTEGENIVVTTKVTDYVTIKGPENVIDTITSIGSETIDITQVTKNGSQKINLILPEGIELVDGQRAPKVTFAVSPVSTKELIFHSTEIVVSGLAGGKQLNLEDIEITVTIKGSASQLDLVTKENTGIYMEVTDIADHGEQFPIVGKSNVPVKSITVSPSAITITTVAEVN